MLNRDAQLPHEPHCPRCNSATWVQILDWSRPLLEEAAQIAGIDAAHFDLAPAEVLYVCHGCNRIYGHPVPDHWEPDPGWLPEYA